MCIMSIALGYFITSRALTPVRKITDSARRISIEDLGVRFKLPEASDEIRDLSLAFNTMFDRLELSVNKLKSFDNLNLKGLDHVITFTNKIFI